MGSSRRLPPWIDDAAYAASATVGRDERIGVESESTESDRETGASPRDE
ncbi:hypothetical protein ACFOZ7_21275 [Natribaculum luteum]|uniref:Uncharacterized protein n=1 Tax=Natribaculum luteum TaxID=1586232 RepID=A0ABD5P553_9EURY|nr:hypothetical protein [Natribaculum luteum]